MSLTDPILRRALETEGEAHEAAVDLSLPFVLTAIGMGVVVRFANKKVSFMPPFTLTIFVLSFLLAWLADDDRLGALSESVEGWERVHPHVILYVLLPPLLFESALGTDFHVFRRVVWPSLLLAVPGVVISMVLTALVGKYIFPFNWSWGTSFLLGSMLSATDPVAVVAVLRTLGAKKKLSILIEGESLLNDGSAFVLFLIFLEDAEGVSRNFGELVEFFLRLAIGGPCWGILCGIILYFFLKVVWNDPQIEIGVVVLFVFSVFFLAEDRLHVSGVLAVVTMGLLFSRSAKYAVSRPVEHLHHEVWELISFAANTLIFAVSGVVIYRKIFTEKDAEGVIIGEDGEAWGYLILLYVLLHVIRALMLLLLSPLLTHLGYGFHWKEGVMLVIGGLRGAVGLALGLLVSLSGLHSATELNFFVAGIVTLTTLVNGSLAGIVYKKLQVYPPNRFHASFVKSAFTALQDESKHALIRLESDWFFRLANFELVSQLMIDFTEFSVHDGHAIMKVESLDQIFARIKARDRLLQAGKSVIRHIRNHSESHVTNKRHAVGSKLISSSSPGLLALVEAARSQTVRETADESKSESTDSSGDEQPLVTSEPGEVLAAEAKMVELIERRQSVAPGSESKQSGDVPMSSPSDGPDQSTTPPPRKLHPALVRARSAFFTGHGTPVVEEAVHELGVELAAGSKKAAGNAKSRELRSEEAIARVISVWRAELAELYHSRDITAASMLVLTEGLDVASEYKDYYRGKTSHGKKLIGSGDQHEASRSNLNLSDEASVDDKGVAHVGRLSMTQNPFAAMWEVVLAGLSRRVYAAGQRLASIKSCSSFLYDALHFDEVRHRVETLRAFVESAEKVLPGAAERELLSDDAFYNITTHITTAIRRARIELRAIKTECPGAVLLVRSTLAARKALTILRHVVCEFHSTRGLLDETVYQEVTNALDQRLHDLESFIPTVHVLGVSRRACVVMSDTEDDAEDVQVAVMQRVLEACEHDHDASDHCHDTASGAGAGAGAGVGAGAAFAVDGAGAGPEGSGSVSASAPADTDGDDKDPSAV